VPGVAAKPRDLAGAWASKIGDCVQALRWSVDGRLLAAASVSGPVHVFDAASGLEAVTLPGHEFGTASASWKPGANVLATAGQDGKLRIWNLDLPSENVALDAGAAWADHVAWSQSGRFLASAAGRKLRLWSADGDLLREYPGHPSTIADIVWKPGSEEVTTASYGTVQFFSTDREEPLKRFSWKGSMLKLAWSPDGKALATGNQDSTVHFWFVATGKDLQMWGYPAKIRELAWDAKSRFLATGGSSTVVVWDCSGKGPANTKPLSFEFHDKLLSQLAFQRRGPLLASGCGSGIVALWNVEKKSGALAAVWLDGAVSQLAWSPDDRWLAAGDESGSVRVFRSL
jgi:WD40 repeat protein